MKKNQFEIVRATNVERMKAVVRSLGLATYEKINQKKRRS